MNKIFKIKRNALGQSIVTSELAKSRSKTGSLATTLVASLLSIGTAIATPSTLGQGNLVTGEKGVTDGYNNTVTAIKGTAQGNNSIATGNNLSRDEFSAKLNEHNALLSDKTSKEGEIGTLGINIEANNQAQTNLNNQIQDLNKIINRATEKSSQLDNLNNQLTGKQNELTPLIEALERAKQNAASPSSTGTGDKTIWTNFGRQLAVLNWDNLPKDDGIQLLSQELKNKVEADFPDLPTINDSEYNKIINGFVKSRGLYENVVNKVQNEYYGKNHFNAKTTSLDSVLRPVIDVKKELITDKIFNADKYFHSLYSIDGRKEYKYSEYDVYEMRLMAIVDKYVNIMENEGFLGNKGILDDVIRSGGDPEFFKNLSNQEKEIIKQAALEKEQTRNDFDYFQNYTGFSSYIYNYFSPDSKFVKSKDFYDSELARVDNDVVSDVMYLPKFKDNNLSVEGKLLRTGENFVEPLLNLQVILSFVNNNNISSLNKHQADNLKNYYNTFENIYNSIDWEAPQSEWTIQKEPYKAKMDKLKNFLDDYVKPFFMAYDEMQKDLNNKEKTTEMIKAFNRLEEAKDKEENQRIYFEYISAKLDESFIDEYNTAKEKMIVDLQNWADQLKLYDPKSTTIKGITDAANKLKTDIEEAQKAVDAKQKEIDGINKQINELVLTPDEQGAADLKRQKEQELTDKQAEKDQFEKDKTTKQAELDEINRQLTETTLANLGRNSLAVGTNAFASGNDSIAIGTNSAAQHENAIAIGKDAKVTASSSIAIGANNNIDSANVVALGNNITVEKGFDNSVVLGNGSMAGVANPFASLVIRDVTHQFAGANPTSTVSVGGVGQERQIINVAAGRITNTSTDAINGSQLYAVIDELNKLAFKAANLNPKDISDAIAEQLETQLIAGDNVTIDKDEATNTFTISAKDTNTQSVVKAGQGVKVESTDNAIGTKNYTVSVKLGEGLELDVDGNIKAKGGNNSSSVDIKSGDVQANNVTANNVTTGNVDVGNVNAKDITAGDLKADKIDSKYVNADNIKSDKIDTKDVIAGNIKSDKVDTKDVVADNVKTDKIDVKDANIDTVKANDVNSDKVKADKIDAKDVVANNVNSNNVSANTADAKIINAGDVNVNNVNAGNVKSDAVNAKDITGDNVQSKNVNADNANIGNVNANNIKAGEINAKNVEANRVKAGNVIISQNGIDAGGERVINVKDGVSPTDAVNMNQLTQQGNQINNRIDNLADTVNKNKKRADAGMASTTAMANIPQVMLAGKSGVGVGVGHRDGQSAVAVGYSRASDNAKHIIKLSAGIDTQSKATVGAGYMYQW